MLKRMMCMAFVGAGFLMCDSMANAGSAVPVPTVTFTFSADSYFATASPALGFTVTGSSPTVECEIDGAAYAACASPFVASSLSDGGHMIYVRADDGVNTPVIEARHFFVDTTKPTLDITAPEAGATLTSNTPDVSFSSNGNINECSFDGAPFTACATPFEAAPLSEGSHTLTVRATDLAGNSTSKSVTFAVFSVNGSSPREFDFTGSSGKVKNGYFTRKVRLSRKPPASNPAMIYCAGKVTITLTPKAKGVKTYKRRATVKASGGRCSASTKFKLPKKYKGKRATVKAIKGAVLGGLTYGETIKKL